MINLLTIIIGAMISVLEWIRHTIYRDSNDYTPSYVSTYSLSGYWSRIEKAHLEILQDQAREKREPITLWWGLRGVRVVDDKVVWVDRPLPPKDKDYSPLPYCSNFNPPLSGGLMGLADLSIQYGITYSMAMNQLNQRISSQMSLINQQINQCCCTSTDSYIRDTVNWLQGGNK